MIGFTIVAFETSAPEFAVTIGAARAGRADVSVGNVVGSNRTAGLDDITASATERGGELTGRTEIADGAARFSRSSPSTDAAFDLVAESQSDVASDLSPSDAQTGGGRLSGR